MLRQESSAFLKKGIPAGADEVIAVQPAQARFIKVFCFFFQKSSAFLTP
jgi:hypothetical protein